MDNHTITEPKFLKEKEVVWLNFFKRKMGLIAVIISLCIILGVLWFCLFGVTGDTEKDGTLVHLTPYQTEVRICRETV